MSASYFDVLGLKPAAGRFFAKGEDVPGAPDHAIGYVAGRRFGFDPAAVGKTIEKDGYTHVIIGVAPPEFFGVSAGSSVDL